MPRFLSAEEYPRFKAYFQPRRVSSGAQSPQALDAAVASLLAGRGRPEGAGIGLHQSARVIQGHRNDGLSWVCERAAEVVAERSPELNLFAFRGQRHDSGLPEIVTCIKRNPSLRIFRAAGLYAPRRLQRMLVAGTILLVAIILAVVAEGLRSAPPDAGGRGNIALAIAVLGGLAAILINHIRLGGSAEELGAVAKRIDEALGNPGAASEAVTKAIEAMARKFHGLPRPACIIIDYSARLDAFTRAVLDRAMRADDTEGIGRVFWIVVEQREAGVLTRELAVRPSARSEYAGGELEILHLVPLTVEENEAVLSARNLPLARARDGLFVKQLVHGANSTEIDQVKAILEAIAQTEMSDTGLRGTTLLRIVAANSDPPGFERSTAEYERLFSERQGEGRRRLFPILLKAYLGLAHVPRERVKELFHGLNAHQGRLVSTATSALLPLRIPAIACDAFKQWQPTQLPQEAIEWFWFLYWARISPPPTATTSDLLKLAHHAKSMKLSPVLLSASDGAAVARETVLALIQLTDACVHRTLFVDALDVGRALLQNVREIQAVPAASAEAMTDQTWTSLTRICWQVYLATGDETFLVRLLSLLADATLTTEPGPAAPRDIVTPFLRVMNTASDELDAMGRSLQQLLTRDASLAVRLRAYMRLRTLNVALLCEAASTPALVVRAGLPSSSEVASSIDKQELIAICDDIYKDAERRFTVLDHLILREALRHTVRMNDVETLRQILPAFMLAAGETKGRSHSQDGTLSLLERAFKLQTIAVGLDAVLRFSIGAAPHVRDQYQHRSAADDLCFRTNLTPGIMARDLKDLLDFAADVTGGKPESLKDQEPVSPRTFALVNQLFLHAALVWEELGLAPLRNRTLMDRAHYLFSFSDADPRHPDTFRAIIESLGPALSASGVEPVLNHIELAEFFRPVVQLRGVYVTEAITQLLGLGVASDISLLFCMFLNHIPSSSSTETAAAVDHVVKLLGDAQFRAHFVDRFGADPAVGHLVNSILGLAPDLGEDFREATDRVANDLMEDPGLNPQTAAEIRTLREFYRFAGSHANLSDAEVGQVLAGWADRQQHWLYPAVLERLVRRRPDAADVVDRSLTFLEQGTDAFQGTPGTRLALRIGEIMAQRQDLAGRDRAARILRQSVAPEAGRWSIEDAEQTFTLLIQLDPGNVSSYVSHHANWLELRLERDRAQAFTQMLHDGHFFGVFRSYWSGLLIYNVPTVVLDEAWLETCLDLLRTDRHDAAVRHCLERIRLAAPPLIARPNAVPSIVQDFVLLGRVLFGPDVPAGRDTDIARQHLNEATGKDLRAFLNAIEICESVPAVIREFIRDHRRFISAELAKARTVA